MNPRQTIVRHLGMILAALTLLLAVGALGSAGYAWSLSRQVGKALKVGVPADAAAEQAGSDKDKEKGKKQKAELSEELKQLLDDRPLFGAKPKQQPNLEGILGDSALIGGNWIRVGEEQGGVKLLEITAYGVAIEFEGQRRELSLWSDLPGAGARGAPQPPAPPGASGPMPAPGRAPAAPGAATPPAVNLEPGFHPAGSMPAGVAPNIKVYGPDGEEIEMTEEMRQSIQILDGGDGEGVFIQQVE
jgi:hypothetical protein